MFEKLRAPLRGLSKNPNTKSTVKATIAKIIFGMICITFIFVGFNPDRFGFNGASGTVASVNDHVITTLEFQERVTAFENQYGEFFKNLPDAQRQYQTKAIRERV
ncbi:MAG: SurA N-terminal domain-containing protein, partial [Bdellovibrionales bacterium]